MDGYFKTDETRLNLEDNDSILKIRHLKQKEILKQSSGKNFISK